MKNLPKHWYIVCTEESIEDLREWRMLQNPTFLRNKSDMKVNHTLLSNKYDGSWFLMTDVEDSVFLGGRKFEPITYEQFKTLVKMNRKITPEQAQRIISIACNEWKQTLSEKWGKSIALRDIIEVNDDFYTQMRHACSVSQNEVLDEIFGKDNPLRFKVGDWIIDKDAIYNAIQISGISNGHYLYKSNEYHEAAYSEEYCRAATDVEIAKAKYKDGDYIYIGKETNTWKSVVRLIEIEGKMGYAINKLGEEDYFCVEYIERLATEEEIEQSKILPKGTPCLVREHDVTSWVFAYSNGDNTYNTGRTSSCCRYVLELDMNNLPKFD
jgi:hypothetical protein